MYADSRDYRSHVSCSLDLHFGIKELLLFKFFNNYFDLIKFCNYICQQDFNLFVHQRHNTILQDIIMILQGLQNY